MPVQITWHGFFTAVGTLVGIWLAVRWAVQAGYTEDDTFSVAMWAVKESSELLPLRCGLAARVWRPSSVRSAGCARAILCRA